MVTASRIASIKIMYSRYHIYKYFMYINKIITYLLISVGATISCSIDLEIAILSLDLWIEVIIYDSFSIFVLKIEEKRETFCYLAN